MGFFFCSVEYILGKVPLCKDWQSKGENSKHVPKFMACVNPFPNDKF